jgi:hypothetical protein
MLAPGITLVGDRVPVTAGPGTIPDFYSSGVGFMNNGSLAIDTNAASGNAADQGYAQSPAGALYGTTSLNASDVYVRGLRVSAAGAIVYESAAAASFVNGDPLTAAGVLAVV